jgi:TM2 domain-containing membrane protein YozV
MRKIFLSLLLTLVVLASGNVVKASAYSADDNLIDQMFASANETTNLSYADFAAQTSPSLTSADKSAPVALILDFFLGELGIHRFYLGTKVMSGLAYPLTCGGFGGIVPLVDFVVLIIDIDDISKYVDNPKFFMWM